MATKRSYDLKLAGQIFLRRAQRARQRAEDILSTEQRNLSNKALESLEKAWMSEAGAAMLWAQAALLTEYLIRRNNPETPPPSPNGSSNDSEEPLVRPWINVHKMPPTEQ
jgi:hypothetical protein